MVEMDSRPVFVVIELSEFFYVNFFPPNFSQSWEFSTMILMGSQLIEIIINWGKNEQQRSSLPGGGISTCKSHACDSSHWVSPTLRQQRKNEACQWYGLRA
jgi:hypothetical protein